MKIAATMELNSGMQRKLFDYLLGLLPDGESEGIEQRLFDDPGFALDLDAAETELLDAWASNQLNARDRELFESHYRTGSPRRARRIAFAQAFSQFQSERLAFLRAPSTPFWQRPWIGFRLDRPWLAAAACSILLIATVGVWRIGTERPAGPVSEKQAVQAQPANPVLTDPVPPAKPGPAIVARAQPAPVYDLAPGLDRSSRSVSLRVPSGTRQIGFRLALDIDQKRPPFATLESLDGKILLRRRASLSSAREARLTLPAKALQPGEYLVRLAGSDGEAIADYIFEIR